HVHQLVLDEPSFESEEEFLPGHSVGWREHGSPFDDPVRLNMERPFVSRIVPRTSACRLARVPGSSPKGNLASAIRLLKAGRSAKVSLGPSSCRAKNSG